MRTSSAEASGQSLRDVVDAFFNALPGARAPGTLGVVATARWLDAPTPRMRRERLRAFLVVLDVYRASAPGPVWDSVMRWVDAARGGLAAALVKPTDYEIEASLELWNTAWENFSAALQARADAKTMSFGALYGLTPEKMLEAMRAPQDAMKRAGERLHAEFARFAQTVNRKHDDIVDALAYSMRGVSPTGRHVDFRIIDDIGDAR